MNFKKTISLIPVLLLFLTTAAAHVGEDDYAHHSMMGLYGSGWFGMGLNSTLVTVILILIIIVLVIIIQEKLRK